MQRKVHVGVIERFQESSSRGTIPLISFFIVSFLPVFLLFLSYTNLKTEVHFLYNEMEAMWRLFRMVQGVEISLESLFMKSY